MSTNYVFFWVPFEESGKQQYFFFSFNHISSFLHLFPASWQNIFIQFGAHIFFWYPFSHFQVIGLICHESGDVDIFMKEFYEFPNGHMEPENAAILREAGSCHRHEIFNF